MASAIRKEAYRARYTDPPNPYHVAMGFGLERVYLELRARGCREGTTHVLFERRGGKEDAELEAEFRRICAGNNATGKKLPFEAVLCEKKCNSPGLQLARPGGPSDRAQDPAAGSAEPRVRHPGEEVPARPGREGAGVWVEDFPVAKRKAPGEIHRGLTPTGYAQSTWQGV